MTLRRWITCLLIAAAAACGDTEGIRVSSGQTEARMLRDSIGKLNVVLQETQTSEARALALKDTVTSALSTAVDLMMEIDRVARELGGGRSGPGEEGALENWDQLLRRRLSTIETRFKHLSREAAETKEKLERLEPESRKGAGELARTREQLEQVSEVSRRQRERIAALLAQLNSLRESNRTLAASNTARSDSIRHLAHEAARVYWIAGTKRNLVRLGVVREEGGVLGVGQSLVPARTLDPTLFTSGDQRVLSEIPLPPGTRWVIISRQDLSYIDPAGLRKGREVAGPIRILDQRFWTNSQFLILVEK